MNSLPPELADVARRVIWFKKPAEALRDPRNFFAYFMKIGTAEDIAALQNILGESELKRRVTETLDHAPPGIMDARSWAYWNLKMGRYPAPPMPVRKFP